MKKLTKEQAKEVDRLCENYYRLGVVTGKIEVRLEKPSITGLDVFMGAIAGAMIGVTFTLIGMLAKFGVIV